ncbi:helix-turn-helix domain-containing protein [Novosphingobium sp. MD-1]|uniref:helix-turn-helix domain-containing protein n=1 Tax=Novosphingobium sp. MD-1 TaxID=1630648 RepID=UPI000F7DCA0B|nr:XRE family transcriptional regulator [Novosphingobium sp. MD-1]
MSAATPTLGALVRGLRSRNGWTLKQMSEKAGIPVSTLSKVEHDRLTLTYDKLQQISQRLGLRMSELFAESSHEETPAAQVTARRSKGLLNEALRVETPNYDYYYLCTELRRKRMIPAITKIRAKTLEQFGDLVRHAGEEFVYVVRGSVVVVTEFYDAMVLNEGESLYIDSSMGHAYLAAEGCDEAEVLGVMSSSDAELLDSLLDIHEEQLGGAPEKRQSRKAMALPRL